MILKCKMCGGDLHPEENATTCVCEFCGTTQTIPRLDSDRRANLYDRANHFRRNNEYDKAMGIFEQILQDDRTDAEAYWSIVLCRYGIEYVQDPATGKRVPTVNRTQFASILADEDYKAALRYADAAQKSIYKEEAAAIDTIQKGILEISKKEKPFDVFICYKETDPDGRRTPDSVLANDLYHQLVREGFKVFFSRITLEDKIGQQYEPYIFAALNTAKVMVVLGTRPEYFTSPWVKNEWSRYLALIRSGADKTLVPAYKDMDPYDLPEEFSHLQALDMGRLGFMQDLIHGIKKLTRTQTTTQPATQTMPVGGSNISALLDRAYMALEDGEWDKADDFCEQVLNQDARNARAYIAKLMAEKRVRQETELANLQEPIESSGNYQKAVRFADKVTGDRIRGYNTAVTEQLARATTYDDAVRLHSISNNNVWDLDKAAAMFLSIPDYKDAKVQAQRCSEEADSIRERSYNEAVRLMNNAGTISLKWQVVVDKLRNQELEGYRDVAELREKCSARLRDCRAAEQEAQKNRKEKQRREAEAAAKKEKQLKIIVIIAAVVGLAVLLLATHSIPGI